MNLLQQAIDFAEDRKDYWWEVYLTTCSHNYSNFEDYTADKLEAYNKHAAYEQMLDYLNKLKESNK